jgi:hypothetical protein
MPLIASVWLGTPEEPSWRMALIEVGTLAFLWVPVGFLVYRCPSENKTVSPEELHWIRTLQAGSGVDDRLAEAADRHGDLSLSAGQVPDRSDLVVLAA